MISRASRIDTGVGVSFISSAVIHVAVFLLLAWSGKLFPGHLAVQETYYVDIVSVPVAAPAAGSAAEQSAAVPPAPRQPAPMTVPNSAKSPVKPAAKSAAVVPAQSAAETEAAFAERMSALKRASEAKREEEILERLRSRVKAVSAAKPGTPGSTGAEAGSRYADVVKSRLEDALKVTSSYTSRNPEVAVRLTISPEGRVTRMKIERSSGDASFELAVRRAIDLASEKFPPPPGRSVFENGFVFKPKGISASDNR